jgi:hypothetical protein
VQVLPSAQLNSHHSYKKCQNIKLSLNGSLAGAAIRYDVPNRLCSCTGRESHPGRAACKPLRRKKQHYTYADASVWLHF